MLWYHHNVVNPKAGLPAREGRQQRVGLNPPALVAAVDAILHSAWCIKPKHDTGRQAHIRVRQPWAEQVVEVAAQDVKGQDINAVLSRDISLQRPALHSLPPTTSRRCLHPAHWTDHRRYRTSATTLAACLGLLRWPASAGGRRLPRPGPGSALGRAGRPGSRAEGPTAGAMACISHCRFPTVLDWTGFGNNGEELGTGGGKMVRG